MALTVKVSNIDLIDDILRNQNELTASQKMVAVALAHSRNTKTLACFPAMRTLAKLTNLSVDTIRKAINALKGDGVIVARTGERKENGRLGGNRYAFTFDAERVLRNGQLDGVSKIDRALVEEAAGATFEEINQCLSQALVQRQQRALVQYSS